MASLFLSYKLDLLFLFPLTLGFLMKVIKGFILLYIGKVLGKFGFENLGGSAIIAESNNIEDSGLKINISLRPSRTAYYKIL